MSRISKLLDSFVNFEKKIEDLSSHFENQFQNFTNFVNSQHNPQFDFKTIHIVGSKGKGSVASLLSQLLSSQFKVGLYTSPHLLDVRERIQINNKKIDSSLLYDNLIKYQSLFVQSQLSYFEILTFLSFVVFRDYKIDWGIFEAGLGGRLDATNVIKPKIVVITSIEKEHQKILGQTLQKIANEKLSVIKPHSIVFAQKQKASVKNLLEEKVRQTKSRLLYEGQDFGIDIKELSLMKSQFFYKNIEYTTSLNTEVQLKNLSLVLAILEFLKNKIDRKKLLKLKLAGRFEMGSTSPYCIFDVAHTPISFQYLLENVKRYFDFSKTVWIVSFYRDKKVKQILRLLKEKGINKIYYVDTNSSRSYGFDEFRKKFGNEIKILSFKNLKKTNKKIYIFSGSFSVYERYRNYID